MGLSMEMESKCIPMGTSIKGNLSMVSQMAMDNICGMINLLIKGISNKELEMGMEYGKADKEGNKCIKDTTCLTGSMVMEYMIGEMDMSTKDFSLKISAMEKEKCFIMVRFNIKVIGKMAKGLIKNL